MLRGELGPTRGKYVAPSLPKLAFQDEPTAHK
jgi:hypothetical protein